MNGSTTGFWYDGNDVYAELNGATPAFTYIRGLNIDEPYIRKGASDEFYETDALGSSVALTNSAGASQTTYTYEPFGTTTQAGTASTNPFQFTGRENDGTGLAYYRARYYSPKVQRFIREDPIEFGGGDSNLYAYVFDSPMANVDPDGQVGLAGFVVGLSIDAFAQYQLAGTVNVPQALIAGAAGAIGAGVSAQIAQVGISGVRSVLLNAGAGLAIGGAAQIATNLVKGCDWDKGLARTALLGAVLSGSATALGNQISNSALARTQIMSPGYVNLANNFATGLGNTLGAPTFVGATNAFSLVLSNSTPFLQ